MGQRKPPSAGGVNQPGPSGPAPSGTPHTLAVRVYCLPRAPAAPEALCAIPRWSGAGLGHLCHGHSVPKGRRQPRSHPPNPSGMAPGARRGWTHRHTYTHHIHRYTDTYTHTTHAERYTQTHRHTHHTDTQTHAHTPHMQRCT